MVLVKGARSKLLWANRAFLDYYGMTNSELLDLIDAPHSDPDDTVQYVKDDHRVFTTGERLDIASEPVTNARGETAYFRTVKDAIRNANGEIVATIGVSRPVADNRLVDLSEQVRARQKDSNSELRILVRNIPLPVAMFDVQRRSLCQSGAWNDLFSRANTEPGSFYDDACESRLPLADRMAEVVRSGQAQQVDDWPIPHPDRPPITANVSINPWSLPSGEVGGTIVLVQDVTEMRRSERRLQTLNEELTQFNYRVSHDLVGPLRTMRGYLGMCQEQLNDNPGMVRDLHAKMIHKVDSLAQLVRDVLDLARADLRDEVVEVVNVQRLVADVIGEHEEALSENVELQIDTAPDAITTSRFRLRQVLENLISNAFKYRDPARSPHRVEVSSDMQGHRLHVTVRDNGIGIDPEVLPKIFDIFVRGSSTHPGSGLGLYLVKKHIEKLGGEITANSRDGHTQFEFAMPTTQEKDVA